MLRLFRFCFGCRAEPEREGVPAVGSLGGQPGREVLPAVLVLRPPAELLHPHLALRLHELRPIPSGLVHESGEPRGLVFILPRNGGTRGLRRGSAGRSVRRERKRYPGC